MLIKAFLLHFAFGTSLANLKCWEHEMGDLSECNEALPLHRMTVILSDHTLMEDVHNEAENTNNSIRIKQT